MSSTVAGNELLSRLVAEPSLARHGFQIDVAGVRAVMISHSGHFRGVWQRQMGAYHWIPAGYSMARYRTASVADAVDFTLRELCAQETCGEEHDLAAGSAPSPWVVARQSAHSQR